MQAGHTGSGDLAQDFKKGMRRLASTICIVTTADGDTWHGMTATAVCSVGADPPSLLVSIAKTASLHEPTSRIKRFCVNVLRAHHHDLVGSFSGKLTGMDRFGQGDWRLAEQGLPYLPSAQAAFFCTVEASMDYGGHGIFVGRVNEVLVADTIDPLLYQDGKLHTSQPHPTTLPGSST